MPITGDAGLQGKYPVIPGGCNKSSHSWKVAYFRVMNGAFGREVCSADRLHVHGWGCAISLLILRSQFIRGRV